VACSPRSSGCAGSGAVGGADRPGATSGSSDESDGLLELVPLPSLIT